MLTTYLKFAFRTLWKDRFYAALNVIGLATGMVVSIIILLYLQNDLTYDQHHQKHEQIYRLVRNVQAEGMDVELHTANSARVLGPVLQNEFPEIISYVRFERTGRVFVNVPGKSEAEFYHEEHLMWADPTVFDVFTYSFLSGNPQTALREKNSIVLTASLAKKYFGEQEALGKTVWIGEGKEPYAITGVIEDLPDNSHLKFDGLLSGLDSGTLPGQDGAFDSESLWNGDLYTYLLFPQGYNPEDFFAKFQPFYDQYLKPFGDQVNGKIWFYLEPLADIHFHSQQENDEPQGNIGYLYAFGGIGIANLLLACINYMNMATARSGSQGKEIGVRKVLGSSRKTLFFSFLGESLILSFMALIVALGVIEIILMATPFNQLIQKELSIDLPENSTLLIGLVGITFFMGIVSGLYPALYLPSIHTIKSLKGTFKSSPSGLRLRKSLVTLQFVISIAIVICTFLMQDQINFMRNKNLGFDKEHLMLVPIQDTLVERQIPAISHKMQEYSNILGTTVSFHVPGVNVTEQIFTVESDSAMINTGLNVLYVGKDYIKTMGIKLLAGRDFQEDVSKDAHGKAFIVNETAAKRLGWYQASQKDAKLENALDKKFRSYGARAPGRVVGVVQDFNVRSLHNAIEPTVLIPSETLASYFYLRLKGENLAQTISYIREKWEEIDPNHPFEYSFLDQKFNELYQADERQSKLISILSGICLMISLLGVLGLSAYTTEQRTKEIGIRKVLGAKVSQIIYLLFSDVVYLVVNASVIATPIAYFITRNWLQDFAYRTEINLLLFVFATIASLLIALLTMSFHSLKIAWKNPVDSLRNE